MKHKDITGLRSGRLVAARYLGNSVWECQCDCGELKQVNTQRIQRQETTSCGCVHGNHTHGLSRTPTYESWAHMHQRCYNPRARQYHWYGGRGVTVCERWHTFENFLSDMGQRPQGACLDRKDPALGYSKENCRWVPLKGAARRNTPMVGNQTLGEYAEQNGLSYHTAYARWRKGKITQ